MNAIPPHEIGHLNTRRLGRRLWTFPRLESTNTLALALADDISNDGLVLLADEQTFGRGQYGRVWTAPPGSSVLLSVILLPPPLLRRPALLTAWAAVSVCETILEVAGLQATIKWPNDVLVAGRKVCGILIEQRNTGHAEWPLAAAVGIGLNVRQTADFFIQADLPLACSMRTRSGKLLETRFVAERLIRQLDEGYDRLLGGNMTTLETTWKRQLGLVGKQVVMEMAHGQEAGQLTNVSWDEISLANVDGVMHVAPERVRHIEARFDEARGGRRPPGS
jgi:BirA family transcriptional regulator, biotin operon repressor / biotin---[acetyl-CoA-carboxylase] ligase